MPNKPTDALTIGSRIMSTQPTDAMIDRLAYLAASIRQGEGPSVRCEGPGDYEVSVARQWVNRVLRAQAMQSARTPPPCAGDDVERVVENALEDAKFGLDFAYQQGLHEFGYDPVETLRAATASPPPCAGDDVERSFAWTATEGYKHYPPYVNLSGNKLAVRGPETFNGEFYEAGERVEIELPPEAIAALGTTPSIVAKQPARKRPGEFTGQAYRENL